MSQTMIVASDIPADALQPGESALLLDGAIYVAASVSLKRDSVNSRLSAIASVRALKSDGTPMLDGHGQPVQAKHIRSCSAVDLADYGGEEKLMKDALLITLGDTTDTILAVADDNIRAAVTVAQVSGDHESPHTLLGL